MSSCDNPHKDNYIVYSVWYRSFLIHIACVTISYVIISYLLSCLTASYHPYTQPACRAERLYTCTQSEFYSFLLLCPFHLSSSSSFSFALHLTKCVIMGKLLHLSVSQFFQVFINKSCYEGNMGK